MITKDNQVALKWAIPQKTPRRVQVDASGVIYVPESHSNVHLIWVDPVDVQGVLNKKIELCKCSGGTHKQAYDYANYMDVLLWETGSRDGQLDSNYVVEE